jgi:hypothetical protein
MKLWIGYGSEHSANLVIIGEFADAKKATETLDLLNEAVRVARGDEAAGNIAAGSVKTSFSDAQLDLFKRTNLSLGYGGPEQFLCDFSAKQDKNKIIITTEEDEVNSFLKILIHGSARIQVYSAHDHGGPYGR